MKNALITAASLAAIAAVVPAAALAQDAASANAGAYANLGFAHVDGGDVGANSVNFEALQARLGYRINDYFGVEGEVGAGIQGHGTGIFDAAGRESRAKLRYELAGYGVGFLPVGPNTDLLARVGYGTSRIKVTNLPGASDNIESVNYGVGAQHRFDGVNGIRVDFTRFDFNHGAGHADVYGVAYTRKF
jgi:outer membrane immunogenic protein